VYRSVFLLAAGVLTAAAGLAAGQSAPVSTAPAGGGILLPMTTGFISGGQEKGAGEMFLASSVPTGGIPDSNARIPFNHCFCVAPKAPTPTDPLPYFIGNLTAAAPQCGTMKMKLKNKPILEQLVFCQELGRCWQSTASWAEKLYRLKNKISGARGEEKKTLAQEIKKIEKGGWASMDKCVSGAIKRRKLEAEKKDR